MTPVNPFDGPGVFSGETYLIDDDGATLALLVTPGSAALFTIGDLGERISLSPFDSSISLSRATSDGIVPECHLVGVEAHWHVGILTAAYCAGIAEAVCAMASEYGRMREQFGRAIGSYQAVKHRCADMAIRADAAWSQVAFAALAVSENRSDAGYQASCARLVAGSYTILGAQDNIQVHGAIGTTDELPAHRYLKRAHLMQLCFDSADQHKCALLDYPDPQEAMT
jgi:alkylation response protein AidB-like acyl-CoA dehydrogenase